MPELNPVNGLKIMVLGLCCAAVSILFCVVLHKTEELFAEKIPNAFVRPLVSGALIILLTLALGTTDYLGTGMQVVERAVVEQQVFWAAFLLKIVFTAITLSGGFKGGEIVPTFFVGATFGCLMGQILHISPSLAGACGMAAVFCGVTNSPFLPAYQSGDVRLRRSPLLLYRNRYQLYAVRILWAVPQSEDHVFQSKDTVHQP